MKTIKVSEATELQLDWLVAKAQGYTTSTLDLLFDIKSFDRYHPTTDWAIGGPIIERESLRLAMNVSSSWTATIKLVVDDGTMSGYIRHVHGVGATPLIATMRCYVASKLGDEVEIPKELV